MPQANRIRELRLNRAEQSPQAFTLAEIARRLRVSESTVRRWENGERMPWKKHRRALARDLKVKEEALGL